VTWAVRDKGYSQRRACRVTDIQGIIPVSRPVTMQEALARALHEPYGADKFAHFDTKKFGAHPDRPNLRASSFGHLSRQRVSDSSVLRACNSGLRDLQLVAYRLGNFALRFGRSDSCNLSGWS
jgi:hypothetical protein